MVPRDPTTGARFPVPRMVAEMLRHVLLIRLKQGITIDQVDAFVRVALYDDAGDVVDRGIDELGVLSEDEIGFAEGDTFDTAVVSFAVTAIDCFNY